MRTEDMDNEHLLHRIRERLVRWGHQHMYQLCMHYLCCSRTTLNNKEQSSTDTMVLDLLRLLSDIDRHAVLAGQKCGPQHLR